MRRVIGQFCRFGVVGTIGFFVDGGLLFLLVSSGTDPYFARALSFPSAATVTWYLNRVWSFATTRRGGDPWRQYRRYFAVQVVGALTNYACYAVVLGSGVVDSSARGALIALVVGSIAGMIVNYTGACLFVFRVTASGPSGDLNAK